MRQGREYATGSKFESDDDFWWIAGGYASDPLDSTEYYNATTNRFSYGVDLPVRKSYANLVNVNKTHMVLVGGDEYSDDIYIIDRYQLTTSGFLA